MLSSREFAWRIFKRFCATRKIDNDLSNALRPFYFAVHPDRFGKHPKERKVNENSLKLLSAHIQMLCTNSYSSMINESKTLQFYIREGNAQKQEAFKLINITLDLNARDPKQLINKLLELSGMPTRFAKETKTVAATITEAKGRRSNDYEYSSDFMNFAYNLKEQVQVNEKTLNSWLSSNVALAQERAKELSSLKEEVNRLKKHLIKRFELQDLRYDCGWNFEHFRGCMMSFERLADMHELQMDILKERVVVFAPFTGVSLEGHIMLYTGDVHTSWLDFIRNIPQQDAFLRKIPNYENTLSQVLLNIRIGRRKFMPKQQAVEYAGHLMKVTTTLGDYLSTKKFPTTWPKLLNSYEIVVESEAGPLMVNPTGQLIIPATCPGFMLIDFLSNNLHIAKELSRKYNELKHVEKQLSSTCIEKLQLMDLTKDDSVTPDRMIDCMHKLLKCQTAPFKNISLHITNYYSVLTDGVVCIPWDFTID